MHEFNAAQQDAGTTKILKSQHGSSTPLDRPMVLFHDIVEILGLADLDGRLTLGVHGVQPGQIGTAFVDGYGFGRAILIDGLLEVPSGRFLVPLGSQQEVNRVAGLVDGAVEILPCAPDLHIGVSRPGELRPESLAEPCVNLSIYTAPVIQPVSPDTASARTLAGTPSSSCVATPHCTVCAVAVFCTCAEPSARAFGRDIDSTHAWLSDGKPRSSSTSHISWDYIAQRVRTVISTFGAATATPAPSVASVSGRQD